MNAFKNDLHDLVARHVAAARGDNNRMLTQLAASEARLASVERKRDEIMAMAERREGELQARLAEAERRNKWMLHNGGLWCDEWPKEWVPSKHGPLIPWLSRRIDAAIAAETGDFPSPDSATHREGGSHG